MINAEKNKSYKILFLTSRALQVSNFIKELSNKNNYQIITDKNFFRFNSNKNKLRSFLANFNIAFVYNFGAIIPEWAIKLVPMVNIHFSLLPRYRGAYPVPAFLLNGDKKTGVSWHILTKEIDQGNILLQKQTFTDVKTLGFSAKQVFDSLEEINFNILRLVIQNIKQGLDKLEINFLEQGNDCHMFGKNRLQDLLVLLINAVKNNCGKKQDNFLASYVPITLLKTKNSYVSFIKNTAKEIFNRVRAFNPDPIARTYVKFINNRREFLLFEVDFVNYYKLKPGRIAFVKKHGLFVGTLLGTLLIKKAGFPGKKILEQQQLLSLKGKITKFY